MALPSKYAPGGISDEQERKVIVLGQGRRSSTNYTIKLIEDRVNKAVMYPDRYHSGIKGDIEMVPMDSFDEVDIITDYVANSRDTGEFMYDDSMELDRLYNKTETVKLDGNLSFLVIDTNFILSHLKILDELKDIGQAYGLQLVIPIAVMHELDGLKGSNKIEKQYSENNELLSGKSVGHLARWANDWVYSCLASRVSTVVGQKNEERLNKLAIKDDAILDCCLYLQKNHTNTLQVLMSNDKNLCMKALLNDILTVSYRSKMSAQLIAETIQMENIHRFGSIKTDTYITREVEVPIKQHISESQDVYLTIYSEIQKLVLSIVNHCMESNYGEDLDLIRNYDRNSTRTLMDANQVMIRFWIPVFSLYFHNKKPFEEQGRFKIPKMVEAPRSKLSLTEFIDYWSQILHTLYQKEMNKSQNAALYTLVQRWEDLADSC